MLAMTEPGELLMTLEIAGHALVARRVDTDEALSEPDRVYVEVANNFDVDFAPLMEADATLVVTVAGIEVRRYSRKLASATFLIEEEGLLHYGLELRAPFFFANYSMNTRKWRDKTTEAIVDMVLGEENVPHVWKTHRASNSRPYTVQYRETARAFVDRLLEYEGFYYFFEEDGTMVIGDTSSAERAVDGLPFYRLIEGEAGLEAGELGLTSITRGANVSSGHATVNDYNFKTPALSLLQSKAADVDADLEVYDYPVGYRDNGVGAVLAGLRLDALKAEKRYVKGTTNVPQFTPARIFQVVHDEEVATWSGSYLIVRVSHHFVRQYFGGERRAAEKGSYHNEFFAIPSDVPWRPKLKTPRPVIQGNHTAHVRGPAGEEIHTDVYGRAKVQFHWDREGTGTDLDSRWIRTLQETSSSMVVSRVGWEVVVGYIDGDPDRPIGVGRNINGKMTPTYGQPDRKNIMTIKTESYPGKAGFNELRIDDSAGSMRMDIHAQRDHFNTVENDKTEKVGVNHFHLVKGGLDRVVSKNQAVTIGADENKDIQQFFTESVKGNRTESIGGSEKVNVKVSSTTNVHQNEKETVGSVRFTLAGLGSVSLPGPKDIAQVVVPHVLGVDSDNMLTGGTNDGGADDGRMAANKQTGGAAGPDGAYGGEGTFGGFGALGAAYSHLFDAGSGGGKGGGKNGKGDANGSSESGGIGGLLGELTGQSSDALGSIVGQVAGGGAKGEGLKGFVSSLASGKGMQESVGEGIAGAAGELAGGGAKGEGVKGFISGLSSGKGVQGALADGLGGAAGELAGGGALGAGVNGVVSGLVSGDGLQSALGQGIQGAIGEIPGPAGKVLGAITSGNGPFGSVGQALVSGNLAAVPGALSKSISNLGSSLKQAVTPEALKSLGTDLVMSMFKGNITKETGEKYTRMIGAAEILGAGGAIMTGTNVVFTELVGGLKMTLSADASIMQSAGKFLVHTVGGMILRKSKEDMTWASKMTTVRVGAEAKFHSDEKVELRSKVIELEAQQKLTLKSGDLVIELTPTSTTIKGTVKAKSGDKIKVSGKPDKLTA